jgi:hypothetical protein
VSDFSGSDFLEEPESDFLEVLVVLDFSSFFEDDDDEPRDVTPELREREGSFFVSSVRSEDGVATASPRLRTFQLESSPRVSFSVSGFTVPRDEPKRRDVFFSSTG